MTKANEIKYSVIITIKATKDQPVKIIELSSNTKKDYITRKREEG